MITTSDPTVLFQISLVSIILIGPLWKIFHKAGFSGMLSLLLLVPIINILLIFYLAFADWPALRDDDAD